MSDTSTPRAQSSRGFAAYSSVSILGALAPPTPRKRCSVDDQITKKPKSNQYRGLRPNPEALGFAKLPEGVRPTRAMRFTLPKLMADLLEGMPKSARDKMVLEALERLKNKTA
jgi:hypothetical protein